MKSLVSPKKQLAIQNRLLAWFSRYRRDMPWRSQKSPYRTFVSEIMLQQTQVKTVIPYFERWMKIFPDIETLARSPIDRVLKLWEGLGYYSRARNFHKAAQIIADKFAGKIPSDYETLLALPGIGKYTAGAIASIAFQKRVPLVDGNVARVFSRLFLIRQDILKPKTQALFYELAASLVPEKNPGDFNQALMELGSLVCFTEMPNCAACPIAAQCLARKKRCQEALPIKSKAAKKETLKLAVGIVKRNGHILVRKRPNQGIWAGLWEFPNIELSHEKNPGLKLRQALNQKLRLPLQKIRSGTPFVHHLTHRAISFYPFIFQTGAHAKPGGLSRTHTEKWVTKRELGELSLPVPFQKILALDE